LDTTPFDCLDYRCGPPTLLSAEKPFEIFTSPYSLGCDVSSELISVSSVQEIEDLKCEDKILLMRGEVCKEQLMPKNFVFYNPDHHKKLVALLEEKSPAAIITATTRNPDQVGALYPYPLIVDGDFNIPNAYCTDKVGAQLHHKRDQIFRLSIDTERIMATANNVIARKNPEAKNPEAKNPEAKNPKAKNPKAKNPEAAHKICVTAHIDAYENSPGASDNASGIVVLMLLAEMLSDFRGKSSLEIAAFNGEDHYSAGGQMDYLHRYGNELDRIRLVINVDDVGYVQGKSAYSTYSCPPHIQLKAQSVLGEFENIIQGEQWFNGDHMIFVQKSVPAIAFTAELISELMATITHTHLDTPDVVDPEKIVEVSSALARLIRQL
jgi:aminopeptidase YwaD